MLWTVQEENTCLLFRKFKKYGDTVKGVCVCVCTCGTLVLHTAHSSTRSTVGTKVCTHTHTGHAVHMYRVAGSCTE